MRQRTEEEKRLQAERADADFRAALRPVKRTFGVRTISGSDGTYLRFESAAEHAAYEAAIHDAEMRHYHQARARYGIWASNQDKYVASVDLLNQHDNRQMEGLYSTWLANQTKEPT